MTDLLNLGPHAGFIVACYLVTLGVIGALFVWILADGARLRARLSAMEAQGVTRRSARARRDVAEGSGS
ncbi:heme exporter protein CcmD [Stappia sp. ES.058]|uniref:heme exporter protein CcmD n=1 Tax=Stappia sp. ES.058 TaxID=1881061 RepID=UPI0008798E08|nr:heme exporter protein CcmD [Stappia sp. ES.058]SDU41521.1 heme exporter protein D [Stappia sp. ES.058]